MKILVLNGSPKEKSDTFRLTDAFLKGLNKESEHEVHIINVINKKITPCRGCFKCWEISDGHCVIQDDQNELLDLYVSADIVIWSFPLYCYSMPSHLKAVLDRTIPLVRMKMLEGSDGSVHHEAIMDFSKKRTLVICGCGFPDWEGNFEGLRIMCQNAFRNPTMVFVPETPLLNIPEAGIVTGPLLEAFEKAGVEYERNASLSAGTVSRLESPMIPRKDYIRNVNSREEDEI